MLKSVLFFCSLLTMFFCMAADLPEFCFNNQLSPDVLDRVPGVKNTQIADFCRAENTRPGVYPVLRIKLDIPYSPDLQVEMEYRNIGPENIPVRYTGTNLKVGKKEYFHALPVSREWKKAVLKFRDYKLQPPEGEKCVYLAIYNRTQDTGATGTGIEVRSVKFSSIPEVKLPDRNRLAGLEKNYEAKRFVIGDLAEENGTLTIRTGKKPGNTRARMTIRLNVPAQPGKILVFEYRNLAPAGTVFSPNFVDLVMAASHWQGRSFSFSYDWRRCVVPLGMPGDENKKIDSLVITSRLSRRQAFVPDTGIAIRNMRIEDDPDYDPVSAIPVAMSAIPHLDWKHTGSKTADYTLTLSGNGKTQTFATGKRNWFHPQEPLAPGIWSWQVTANGKTIANGKFRVTEDSHRWKAPEVSADTLLKLPHPRLKAFSEYRDPNTASLLKKAEDLLKYKLPADLKPYAPGQDPRCRSFSEWTSLAGRLIAGAGRNMQQLGAAAMRSSDPRFTAKTKELLLAVARTWDPEGGSYYRHSDLAAADLLIGMSFAYDAVVSQLSPEEKNEVLQALRIRSLQFWQSVNPIGRQDGNHCWNRVSATAFAALATGEELERFQYAISLFSYRFLPGRGFDGETEEGLAYWSYGFGLAMRFLDLARTVGADIYQQPWCKHTVRYPLYCAPPDGYCVSFADTSRPNHTNAGYPRSMLRALANQIGDPAARWIAGYPADGPVEFPINIPQSIHFRHIGTAIFNTFLPNARENVQLGFHSGTYFNNHQHADQNSFVINAYGDKLAVDGGYYDTTDSPHFVFYSVATNAHNTILVDGKGQSIHTHNADGKITGFQDSGHFGYVAGDASNEHIYNGMLKKFHRQIVFVKPDYIVVYDTLAAPQPVSFQFLLHAHQRKGLIPVQQNRFSITRPKALLHGQVLLPENAVLKSDKADYIAHPRQWDSDELIPILQPEQVLTVTDQTKVRKTEFLVPMQVGKPGTQAVNWTRESTDDAVAARTADAFIAFSRTPGRTVKVGDLEFDGPAAAIRFDAAGNPVAGMCSGKVLNWKGHAVPRSTSEPAAKQAASILWNGKKFPAEKYVRNVPGGRELHCLNVILPDVQGTVVKLATSRTGTERHFSVANPAQQNSGTIPAGQNAAYLPTAKGMNMISIISSAPMGDVEITNAELPATGVITEKQDYVPAKDAILLEGESMDLPQSSRPAHLSRKGASGGMISAWWRGGTTAEWDLALDPSGEYLIRLRLANGNLPHLMKLVIDGGKPIIFQTSPTAGWGYKPTDWRYFRLKTPVPLTAGKHKLQLTSLGGDGNLDCFVFEKIAR